MKPVTVFLDPLDVVEVGVSESKQTRIFSATCCLDLHNAIFFFTIDVNFHQVKLLMFYNVQTTNLTFVGKICDV